MSNDFAAQVGEAAKEMLGENWKGVHECRLHTIGNLELTGYHPELGNKPFPAKQSELLWLWKYGWAALLL